jgi:hypothetical protein
MVKRFIVIISNFFKNLDMKQVSKIPAPIQNALDEVAQNYSDSKATTNAGVVLRLVTKFIKPSTVIKMFAHKLSKR